MQQGFIHAAGLGCICTQPIGVLHADHIALAAGPVDVQVLEGLASFPAFAKPMNRAISRRLRLQAPQLSSQTVKALETDRAVQALCALISAPLAQIEAFLKEASAVRMQAAILKCVLKSERQKAQMLFGDSAYNTAVREAQVLFPALAVDMNRDQLFAELSNEWGVFSSGASMLRGFARRTDAGLLQLLDLRLPKATLPPSVELTDAEAKAFARLLLAKAAT